MSAVNERERVRALVADHQEMRELAGWNAQVRFETNTDHAPTRYTITLDCPGFQRLADDGRSPISGTGHRIEITLGAEYPRQAPFVRWVTPLFHPNVHPDNGAVCLGVLLDRYLPGLGLARLVTMLLEMAQYRNFDMTHPLNPAAATWAADPANWEAIREIGGSPLQGPVEALMRELDELCEDGETRPRVKFRRVE